MPDGETVAARTVAAARGHGLIVRAMGDTVVLAPPLIAETSHFAEAAATAAGQRVFNVNVNGARVLTNFDVFAAAGGRMKALTRDFSVTAGGTGRLLLQFLTVRGSALVNGIEVFAV